MEIRIVVPATTRSIRTTEELASIGMPGVHLSVDYLTAGPTSIESRVEEALSVPGLIAAAIEAEKAKVDAIVIDCMGDPGLGAVREAVRIPVLGVAQTSMAIAANLAQSFGVVTVLDRITTLINELVDLYGYGRHYVGCRAIDVTVLDIHDDIARVRADLAEAALRLVHDRGAAAIILGCSGFFGCAAAIAQRLREAGYNIPVIDPVPVAVGVAATLVRNGLTHSQISYPPHDASQPVTGYASILPRS